MTSKTQELAVERTNTLNIALNIIATDAGIQQLVPYWIQFITQQIVCHMHDLLRMRAVCSMVMSMVKNERIQLELYLNQVRDDDQY